MKQPYPSPLSRGDLFFIQKSQETHGTYLFTDRCFLPDLTGLGEVLLRGAWRFKFLFYVSGKGI